MKNLLTTVLFIFSFGATYAQTYDATPPYLKTKEIPSFNILQADSSWFKKENLPKDQPTVIIYFNPDCGHCQLTAKEMSESMGDFKNVTFLWVTYLSPLEEITKFQSDFKLSSYPNVHFGKDLQYFIPSFFRIEQTPFVALYDKNLKFVKAWPMYFKVSELKKALIK